MFVRVTSCRKRTGKRNSIKINKQYKTSIEGVFATGDVTTGETLVVKAMASGREAAQRVHGYLMNHEDSMYLFMKGTTRRIFTREC